ncbi:hypothetical protein K4F52_002821 [Lecanicillium sp. MT-2017a]|nr:hypothetical protein K4F52_002821 [Lecanicillium sp. MT-2017a]
MRPSVFAAVALAASISQALPADMAGKDKDKIGVKENYTLCRCYCLYDCREFCHKDAKNNPLAFMMCYKPCVASCSCKVEDATEKCYMIENKKKKPWVYEKESPIKIEHFPSLKTLNDTEIMEISQYVEMANRPKDKPPGSEEDGRDST